MSVTAATFLASVVGRIPEALQRDPLVRRFAELFAIEAANMERDLIDVARSHCVELADPEPRWPRDLVRLGKLVGFRDDPGDDVEAFRRRLRLFVSAFLQGAGTASSLLTMAAAQIDAAPSGSITREGNVWILPVRHRAAQPDVIRLEENPYQRVERPPVEAKTGTRWTIDNPGAAGGRLVTPEVAIEALVDGLHGPSLVLEDLGLAWLTSGVTLHRGERLVLRTGASGRFSATKHGAGAEDVTGRVELLGAAPDVDDLREGVALTGGGAQPASVLIRDAARARAVRFRARSPGLWGNGLRLRRAPAPAGDELVITFDPILAATGAAGGPGPSGSWSFPCGANLLAAATRQLAPGRALVEAEPATLFLPLGRSHWTYLDHVEASGPDGGREMLARLVLQYTRFGRAAYDETDDFQVYRYGRPDATFGSAVYTTEVERARITFAWREPRPAAVRLSVPTWPDVPVPYDRLGQGLNLIRAAGIAASVVHVLRDDGCSVGDGVAADATASDQSLAFARAGAARHLDESAAAEDTGAVEPATLVDQVATEDATAKTIGLASIDVGVVDRAALEPGVLVDGVRTAAIAASSIAAVSTVPRVIDEPTAAAGARVAVAVAPAPAFERPVEDAAGVADAIETFHIENIETFTTKR